MQHTIKKILAASTVLTVLLGTAVALPILTQQADAQTPTTPVALQVSCIPSAAEVRTNTPVTWRATVVSDNPDAAIFYSWSGVNITTQNSPSVTTSYGSIGTKEATVTIVSQGSTATATCSIDVKNNAPPSTGTGAGNNNSNSNRGTPPETGETQVEEDSPARRQQGEGQGGSQFQQQLQQLAKSVLECTLKNMLGQGLSGLLGGLGGGGGSNPLSSIMGGGGSGGGIEGLLGGLLGGGQAVPVNTVSINDYVKSTTAKETGLPTAGGLFQSPSMDSIAYCLANSVVKYTSEGAARWMNTGMGGNPAYIENPGRYLEDTKTLATERFIQQYSQKPGFSVADQTALNQIIAEQQGVPAHLRQNQPTPSNESLVEKFTREYGDPNESAIVRTLEAKAELESQQGSALKVAEFEAQINEGFISKKDPETGDVTIPGIVAGRQAQTRVELAEDKLVLADELGETLEALFEAIFSMIPGGLLQKVLQ